MNPIDWPHFCFIRAIIVTIGLAIYKVVNLSISRIILIEKKIIIGFF